MLSLLKSPSGMCNRNWLLPFTLLNSFSENSKQPLQIPAPSYNGFLYALQVTGKTQHSTCRLQPSPLHSLSTVQTHRLMSELQTLPFNSKSSCLWTGLWTFLPPLPLPPQPPPGSIPELNPTKAPLHFTVLKVQSLHIQACNCQRWVVVDRHSLHCLLFLLYYLYAAFENNQVLATEQITDRQVHQLSYSGPWMHL